MVLEQVEARGIRGSRVLQAMRAVPRHRFVLSPDRAYADQAASIGEGQTISQPYIVGLMTEALELSGPERVLEIGTGSGYQTAILAELAESVFSVERIPVLAERAVRTLSDLGYKNVKIRVGDGTLGWPEEGPYQGILVAAASPAVPLPLLAQLGEAGRLVIPIGDRFRQAMQRVVRRETLEVQTLGSCVFVPLIGRYGWPPDGEMDEGGGDRLGRIGDH